MTDKKRPIFYANAFSLRMGDNDAPLVVGFNEDPVSPGAMQEEAGIVMTPRTLKILLNNLTIILDSWEKQNGPIAVPPGKMFESWEEMVEKGQVRMDVATPKAD